jgi:hypothetical protein
MSVHDEVFTGRSPHLYQGKSETVMLGCLKPREVSEKSFEFLDQLTRDDGPRGRRSAGVLAAPMTLSYIDRIDLNPRPASPRPRHDGFAKR